MNVFNILLKVLGLLVIIFILFVGIYYIFRWIKEIYVSLKFEIDSGGLEAWCNDCDTGFPDYAIRDDKWKYKFCPHCGKKLTLHRNHPEYKNKLESDNNNNE